MRLVAVSANGLGCKVLRVERGAVTKAHDDESGSPKGDVRVLIPHGAQPTGNGADGPAGPDGPAVFIVAGDEAAGDDGRGDERNHNGQCGDARANVRVVEDSVEVERDVVELSEHEEAL